MSLTLSVTMAIFSLRPSYRYHAVRDSGYGYGCGLRAGTASE